MSRSLDQRRTAILTEIAQLGPAMPGSLVFRHNRCARPDCHCRADQPQLHGPYPAWTRKIDGKTVTRSLRPEQADRYQPIRRRRPVRARQQVVVPTTRPSTKQNPS